MPWRVATRRESRHNGVALHATSLHWSPAALCLKTLTCTASRMNRHANSSRRLLNLLEDVMADLRAAQAENPAPARRDQPAQGRAGPAHDQAQHAATASQGPLLGTGTAHAESVVERPQDGPHRRSTGSRWWQVDPDPLAAGCRVQGLRGRGGAGRDLPHRQCPVP